MFLILKLFILIRGVSAKVTCAFLAYKTDGRNYPD